MRNVRGKRQGLWVFTAFCIFLVNFMIVFSFVLQPELSKFVTNEDGYLQNLSTTFVSNASSKLSYGNYLFVPLKKRNIEDSYYVYEKIENGLNLITIVSKESVDEWLKDFNSEEGGMPMEVSTQLFKDMVLRQTVLLPNDFLIELPNSVDDIPITMIGSLSEEDSAQGFYSAFSSGVFEINRLPNQLQVIGKGAFQHALMRETLTLPSSVVRIEDSAFEFSEFIGTLTLPVNLQYIGKNAFANSRFNGELIVPASVEEIGENAFARASFSKTTIPDGVKVGANAFASPQPE